MTLKELKTRSPHHAKNINFYADKQDANKSFGNYVLKEFPNLSKEDKMELLNNIQKDINKSIYYKFPVIGRDLSKISLSLYNDIYEHKDTKIISQQNIVNLHQYGYLE